MKTNEQQFITSKWCAAVQEYLESKRAGQLHKSMSEAKWNAFAGLLEALMPIPHGYGKEAKDTLTMRRGKLVNEVCREFILAMFVSGEEEQDDAAASMNIIQRQAEAEVSFVLQTLEVSMDEDTVSGRPTPVVSIAWQQLIACGERSDEDDAGDTIRPGDSARPTCPIEYVEGLEEDDERVRYHPRVAMKPGASQQRAASSGYIKIAPLPPALPKISYAPQKVRKEDKK